MAKHNVDQLIQQANQAAGRQDWKTAHERLVQAETIDPENCGVINGLGVVLMLMGKPKEAAMRFEKLTKIMPDSVDAFCSLGNAYANCSELAMAENAYFKALQAVPDDRGAKKGLAVVLLQQSVRFGEGMQILNSLLRSDPGDIETILMLANCYEQGENQPMANKYFELAIKTDPKNELAKLGLARVGNPGVL